jgi:hypothetical protein
MSNWIDTTTGALRAETDHRREELARSWSHHRHQGGAERPAIGRTPRTTQDRRARRRWWSPAPAGA